MSNQMTPVDGMSPMPFDYSATIMRSNQIWLGGCQSMMHSMTMDAYARCELGLSNWTALSKAKPASEAMQIQVSQAHAAIQRNLDGSTKFSKASVKLVEDLMAPITATMTRSIEKATAAAE